MERYLKVIFGVLVLLVHGSIAAVVYENDFNVHGNVAPGSPLSDNGWGGYVTASDTSVLDVSTLTPDNSGDPGTSNWGGTSKGVPTANTYLWMAPKNEGSTDAGVETLLFSTDLGSTVSLAALGSIAVKQSFDGTAGDTAKGRFAIQIGSTWYASAYNWESSTEDGTGAGYSDELVSGVDFTDGNNWLALTATVGGVGTGEITLGSAVGGTLTGDISAFGVYAEHGNAGDHIRIDDYQVNAVDPAAYYVAVFPTDWTDSVAWSDGYAATSGTVYYATNSVVLKTPAATASFPGVSLNLVGPQRMEIMVSGSDVITVADLTMDAADLGAGVVDSGEAQIDGQITVTSNSAFSGATDNSRDLRILSQVVGGAAVSVELDAPTKTVYIDNAGNTFSGTWIVADGTGEFTSAAAVGSAGIEVQSSGTLRILGDWEGFDNGDSLTVADSATATVDLGANEWTVSGLTVGAAVAATGTYNVAQLNALGNAVFSGTGTIQVGPAPIPEILVGWEEWTSTISPATLQTNGITGVATNTGFTPSRYAGSNDGTFGSLEYPAASGNIVSNYAGIRMTPGGPIDVHFLVENTSISDVDLGMFHFDALAKTVDNGVTNWVLEVLSGDLTLGAVITNELDFVASTGNLADYDVDLTGLADHTLEAGGSVVFRLGFIGNTGTAPHKLDVDNVAVTKAIDSGTPPEPEPPVIETAVSGGDLTISWTEDGFKLQTRESLTTGDWADVPGATSSPVVVPMTNDVEFLRLVYP